MRPESKLLPRTPTHPVPGLWPGSCHVTAPGTTGPGNEVSFYSVSALLAKQTVAPNRISFLINKEERQRGCWVGEYQFPPRGPSPSVAMLRRSHRVCYRPAATAPVGCLSLMEAPGEGLAHLVHR